MARNRIYILGFSKETKLSDALGNQEFQLTTKIVFINKKEREAF
jgi:hypothetical protein